MQKSKAQIIANIRLKASKSQIISGHNMRHDPEPQTPDLAQNVGSATFSLLIDMPRHCR